MSTPRVPRFRRNSKKFVRLEGGAQGLPRLADRLNEFQGQAPPSWGKLKRKMLGPSETEACRTVEDILADLQDVPVTDPVPARLVAKFNKLAEELPVQLCIRQNETGVTCSSVSLRVENLGAFEAVWWLWANLHHPARLRLKRCPMCQKWFVDQTKPHTKRYCADACKWQYWNRQAREEAGHRQYKRRRLRPAKKST